MDDQRTSPPTQGTADVREAWGRVTAWMRRHDPAGFAALGGPGSEAAISRAERRMGLELPRDMRQWLLANDFDTCDAVFPDGRLLLGLKDIEWVYQSRMGMADACPSEDPDDQLWRREWVPIAAETDGHYGTFLDTVDGTIGTWSEAEFPHEDEYASLSAFFHEAADRLEGVSSGEWRGPGGLARARALEPRPQDVPVRLWAHANGYLVNERGRVPAAIREAYEASRR
ncbi:MULTISPECIES: histone-like nucleoid-structuring protein Lsr2 [unclassified Streptomyces]|uniref:Lsr2 family DNA-binding protein n=1 Tax=unclassified Streptomyces TaxID=2593676 RepID=UPI00381481AF